MASIWPNLTKVPPRSSNSVRSCSGPSRVEAGSRRARRGERTAHRRTAHARPCAQRTRTIQSRRRRLNQTIWRRVSFRRVPAMCVVPTSALPGLVHLHVSPDYDKAFIRLPTGTGGIKKGSSLRRTLVELVAQLPLRLRDRLVVPLHRQLLPVRPPPAGVHLLPIQRIAFGAQVGEVLVAAAHAPLVAQRGDVDRRHHDFLAGTG